MTVPATRANKAAKAWKQLLCDPKGNLTEQGRIALSDLAKYCRYADAPTRHDATQCVDALATLEAVGMHKLYRRILMLLSIDEMRATQLTLMRWTHDEQDDDTGETS